MEQFEKLFNKLKDQKDSEKQVSASPTTNPSPQAVHKEKEPNTATVSLVSSSNSTGTATSGSVSQNTPQITPSGNQPTVNINAFLGGLSSKNQELAPPIDSVAYADELVKEYLLFRGFTQTFKTFNAEKKNDKVRGFQAGKIVELLFHYIQTFNLTLLLDLWSYLNEQFFVKVERKELILTVHKLDLSLKRYYVVHCVNKGQPDKVKEFFEVCGDELSSQQEWSQWFALPYISNPQNHPAFKDFFTKLWFDTFSLSLHNFLSTVFYNVPLPKLLNFHAERVRRKVLEDEIDRLQNEVVQLTGTNAFVPRTPRKNSEVVPVATPLKEPSPATPQQKLGRVNSAGGTTSTRDSGELDMNLYLSRRLSEKSLQKQERRLFEIQQETYTGHTASITKVKFSPNGTEVASASSDGTVKIWSVRSIGRRVSTMFCFSEVLSLSWEHKAKLLLCGTEDCKLKVYSAASDKLVADLKTDKMCPRILDVVCSPNGTNFVTAATTQSHSKASLLLWNMKNFQVENVLPVDPDSTCINCVAFNHNGTLILTGGSDGMIRIYDVSFCSAIMGWNAHDGEVISVQFTADETSIISMGSDGKILKWSMASVSSSIFSYDYEGFVKNTGRAADLAFDATGEYFAVGSKSNNAYIYKVDSSSPFQTISGHTAPVVAVDWTSSIDGDTYLATGSLDQSVLLSKLL
mmetsp:Transcript_11114/g.15332  ORF Transcript_11114/g.15332 Transcript_11114/m.15332 type:complete len:688 (+) Transcript_11114:52-2115(+)